MGPGVPVQNGLFDLSKYERGYYAAAELIAEHLSQPEGVDHSLLYPALYLYRHSLELMLKGLVFEGMTSLQLDEAQQKKIKDWASMI